MRPRASAGYARACVVARARNRWYAHLLMNRKRWAEAERESRATLEVDPLSLVANIHLAEFLFATGKTDAAIAQYRRAIEMDPTFGTARGN